MRINIINSYNNFNAVSSYSKPSKISSFGKNEMQSCFERCLHYLNSSFMTKIKAKRQEEEKYFTEFLYKPGKVSVSEYNEIKKNHPAVISQAMAFCDNNTGTFNCYKYIAHIAADINKYLKSEYGSNDKYRIISIGTSPAAVCEVLQCLGNEVIFLPATKVSSYKLTMKPFKDLKTAEILKNYLKYKNIGNDKDNIVLDYTYRGETLDVIYNFIKNELNIDDDKIKAVPCGYLAKRAQYKTSQSEMDRFLNSMQISDMALISNVPHFHITNSESRYYKDGISMYGKTQKQVFDEFDNYSQPLARANTLASLAVIDSNKKYAQTKAQYSNLQKYCKHSIHNESAKPIFENSSIVKKIMEVQSRKDM